MVNYKNQKSSLFLRLPRKLELTIQSEDVSAPVLTTMQVTSEHTESVSDVAITSFTIPDKSMKTDLNQYLNRPVLIKTISWAENSNVTELFYPWYEYFNHTSIKKRIDNYAFIKCNLNVRVLITASPFYYGAAMVSYCPFLLAGVCPISSDTEVRKISKSQRPSFNIYPQQSMGGQIKLPFIWHKEYLKVSASADFQNIGAMEINSFQDLRNANSVSGDSATIQVFAWASEVEISGATAQLALQSRDEYHVGPVSRPASALAHFAGRLSDWPIIGRFATATSLASGAVANIASLFGFTNVPNIDTQSAFRPTSNPLLATTDIGTAVEKLTVDAKNELTVDNSAYSAGPIDPLSIHSLINRESYLTSFDWVAGDVAEDLLFNCAVTPALYSNVAYTYGTIPSTGYKITNTPMSMVANLFQYWRGDVKFRFVFNCSQFHRGKVRIIWDPLSNVGSFTSSYTEIFSRVVDLSQEQDVSVVIPYNQATAFLPLPRYMRPDAEMYSGGSVVAIPPDANGMLAVAVLNKQTSPVASASIQVLVYVSMVEGDFESPSELDKYLSPYPLQSGDCCLDTPVSDNLYEVEKDDGHLNLVYMGEKITSLRQLMRRSNFSMALAPTSYYDSATIISSLISRMPLYPGYDPNGIASASKSGSTGEAPYNYCHYTSLNWVTQCFVGYRGSVIWNINMEGAPDATTFQVARSYEERTAANYIGAAILSPGSESYASWAGLFYRYSSIAGASLTNGKIQTGLSFLAPWYSRFKFAVTTPLRRTLGNSFTGEDTDSLKITAKVQLSSTNNGNSQAMNFYCGIGTDFDPVFFLNVPLVYYRAALPSPGA